MINHKNTYKASSQHMYTRHPTFKIKDFLNFSDFSIFSDVFQMFLYHSGFSCFSFIMRYPDTKSKIIIVKSLISNAKNDITNGLTIGLVVNDLISQSSWEQSTISATN